MSVEIHNYDQEIEVCRMAHRLFKNGAPRVLETNTKSSCGGSKGICCLVSRFKDLYLLQNGGS